MNDFLHNLRIGKNGKTQVMMRKTQNRAYHYTTQSSHNNNFQSRGFQHRKSPIMDTFGGNQMSMDDDTPSLLVEAFDNLNKNMDILSLNQKYLVKAQERTADMIERQVTAIEKVLDHIDIIPKQLVAQEVTKEKYEKTD